ncbi:hypothetical protein PLICRDRAFT_97607 [Plicaturopsis crispa FD-325 SS-3]|nr:hypothetical protein PLICRDRAFT_97607 [Plicaturopsis crispa FD-325 SS-3]
MSRMSVRQSIRPSKHRESVFTGSSELYRGEALATCPPNLLECVYAMEDCCEEAHEAQELLRNGTFDLPRMSKILESQKVFLLIDEGTVRKYKSELTEEIEPQINELIERATNGKTALMKKQALLQAKVEAAQSRPPARPTTGTSAASKLEARRLQMLVKQRERLEDELQALESEVQNLVIIILAARRYSWSDCF